jgi:cupin 2 domain-containing protein
MRTENIFDNIPEKIIDERFDTILKSDLFQVKRIVSRGHASPDNFWYDQEQNEWVIILKGSAGLQFEGENHERVLKHGDHINIPAHTRHRVNWTDKTRETVWLAVYYD